MGIKKKFGLGLASAALGLSLIGGGTYAFFSDTEVTHNTFAAGTLDLSVDPGVIVNLKDLKPGDTMMRDFKLANNGSLKIKDVKLKTEYSVVDAKGNNGAEDFGKHIMVRFLWNWDKENEPIFETTLADLKAMSPDLVQKTILDPFFKKNSGLEPGAVNDLWVQFDFLDNGQDQNVFQGDTLKLDWTFNASQTAGEAR
ncbi:CalY family protein [Neobacillus novalis]|uniref:CalY family protein n=1 Tax=Neobacillus novalis TaxID=220687 RepID=A0AA95MTJ0_9BACI|nr:CalY family protein [Neobacillus novalis]WHY87518.1 CalY family protein [Neobacillus novalis]